MIKKGFEQTPKNAFLQTKKLTEQIIFIKSSVILTHPWDVEKKNTLKNSSLETLFAPNRKKNYVLLFRCNGGIGDEKWICWMARFEHCLS
jgi:hypothetical protein